ncbi:MAG: hypothetical protein G3M78_06285 [Candidatus Nitrohelix vancouverensis]|uniref:Glycosyltransferase RgtA/B/C/D-like domain-containing protein n=1 Tax=Candidatus Nitrohelix vancouverensis TaxID=2705534 RepID=A0A7T0C270_9BACT|nr:MAG: hypothetical protein G3M78_06285 [Candidatus Nitrohelix vancouverensis]
MKSALKFHFPRLLLLLYASLLIFPGLSDSALQVDEGGDTFVSATILEHGVPVHSDGSLTSMPYANVYDGLFVYRTWFPYYLQAASLWLFGKNELAARLPFALCGLLSILALYALTYRHTRSRLTALIAGLLLASSPPALMYFRAARYVGLPILLSILMLYFYLKIFENKSWRPLPFIIVCFVFFQTMYVEFAGLLAGMLLHLFLHRNELQPGNFRRAMISGGIIALLTLPWLIVILPVFSNISQFYQNASALVDPSPRAIPMRFAGYLFQINNTIFPLLLLPCLWMQGLRPHRPLLQTLGVCMAGLIGVSLLHSIPLYQYIAAGTPFLCIALALVCVHAFPNKALLQSGLVLILISSNALHVAPLLPLRPVVQSLESRFDTLRKRSSYNTFLRETQLRSAYYHHWQELAHPYRGPLDEVIDFFRLHGKPGETCYIDNESESLAFHTELNLIGPEDLTPDSRPDWIVLRGDHWFPENADRESDRNIHLPERIIQSGSYRKYVLNAPVKRINNSYDIQLRRTLSPTGADKIRIYQRIP